MPAQPFIGEIVLCGFNFAPIGWARCEAQLMPISGNEALFSLIGTTYGGDGAVTFALPDLRGRVVLHQGQGPGQPNYAIGQAGGQTQTTIALANMPAHTHALTGTVSQPATAGAGTTTVPTGNIPALNAAAENYAPDTAFSGALAPLSVTGTAQATGSGQPLDNMPPYLAVGYCIALEGVYPARS
jgi:microcystin-dependent protein